jgi:3-oxoacyl-(acyl-carrier-protein) synthase/malonyl CoA-acyl carrier protein transacylase
MGAVFPGAGDAPSFWTNIRSGTDAITEVSPDRWDPAVYCDPAAGDGRFYCRRGGFLGDLAEFDPVPFGIMPAAVDGTDPDQLLMLRAAAEAIKDAGGLPSSDRAGVIIGRGGYLTPGFARLEQRVHTIHQLTAVLSDLIPGLSAGKLTEIRAAFEARLGPPEDSIGLVPNFAASRLANRFDLHGPAYTVDAACASSLVAVDHAVRELATGRCDAVLAGGVHTCHHPTIWSVFTRLRALSPGGVIRPLSAAADGTLLSEGTGAVVLKRLADARAAGDRIYAVIRGVGISSDGRAASMMNPLVEGQELAIRRAWDAARLDPAAPGSLGLLEAHGTATPVGDKAELTALGRVFGPPEASAPPIGIGTVKSMIGHAMPAAGIAGLIKAAYAVHDGVLPPTLHVGEPNPAFAASRFAPVTRARPWEDDVPRRAAVSAFGFGGINAHVIVEADEAPARSRRARTPAGSAGAVGGTGAVGSTGPEDGTGADGGTGPEDSEMILRLTAGGAAEMTALLDVPDAELLARAGQEPADGGGACRLAIVAPDARKLALARKVAARGTPWRGRSDLWFTPSPLLRGPEQVAFLFPGFEPEFTPRVESMCRAFGMTMPVLHGTSAADGGDGVVEQALDVITVSRLYAAVLGELGITPGALAGHSLGEWTAMIAAGIYPDIEDFMASLRPGMIELPDVVYLALGAGAARAGELIDGLDGVVLTHDNCPRQAVVCGPAAGIAEAGERAREAGILAQAMPFRTGFHSPMFAPYTPPMRETLRALRVRPARTPIWSATALAEFPRDPDDVRELVLRHLVEPVRFTELVSLLHDSGIRAFVQLGPGSLTGFADDTLDGRDFVTVATATPKRDWLAQLRRAAAALWAEGLSPRLSRLSRLRNDAIPAGDQSASGNSRPPSGAAGDGKPVRLRLGEPLVRLTGAVAPLTQAVSGAREIPETGDPLLTELNALLTETAQAAESVVAAVRPGPGLTSAMPVPAASSPGGITLEREFSLRTMPDIADHCIFPQPDGWPDDTDRFPVVPMTTLLEIMGDAALELMSGRSHVVTGFEQVRALRWLPVAPATHANIRAVPVPSGPDAGRPDTAGPDTADPDAVAPDAAGQVRVRVSIKGYATGYVLLSGAYPAAPAADTTPLRGQRPVPVSARELYDDGWMFHGPRFAGVTAIAALADDGIAGTIVSLPARGALLDNAGQLVGHWMQVSRTTDQTVLPSGIRSVRFYGPQPDAGQPVECTGRIRGVTDTEMRADAELRGADGRLWCRIEGWTTRRFATNDTIWRLKFHPETSTLSRPAPDGWHVVREDWPDTASRELMMRRYLNAAERAEYERHNPLQQRRWLLGRIAAKDAARRELWARGAGPVYPCELTVTEPGTGTATPAGIEVRATVPGSYPVLPVSVIVSPADRPGRPYATAAAGDSRALPPPDAGDIAVASPS